MLLHSSSLHQFAGVTFHTVQHGANQSRDDVYVSRRNDIVLTMSTALHARVLHALTSRVTYATLTDLYH